MSVTDIRDQSLLFFPNLIYTCITRNLRFSLIALLKNINTTIYVVLTLTQTLYTDYIHGLSWNGNKVEQIDLFLDHIDQICIFNKVNDLGSDVHAQTERGSGPCAFNIWNMSHCLRSWCSCNLC